MFVINWIVIAIIIAICINLGVLLAAWGKRQSQAGQYFLLGMSGITFWSLMSALDYAAVSIRLKIAFATLEAWGYMSALTFIAMFVVTITGYEWLLDRAWFKGMLYFIPGFNILLISTNSLHNLVWTDFVPVGNNLVEFVRGPAYPWIYVTGNIMILCMVFPLLAASFRGSDLVKRQARLLLVTIFLIEATNIIYQTSAAGVKGIDWSSVTFSIIGVIFLSALRSSKLLDIIPIARDRLIQTMNDAIIVLDTKNRLTDMNPAAQALLNINAKSLGAEMNSIIQDWPAFQKTASGRTLHKQGGLNYEIHASPLSNQQGKPLGTLVVIEDITERTIYEETLNARIREIEALNHDLLESQEQVIEQQRTLARVEERQRLGRDMHDSVNQSIHGLMLYTENLKEQVRGNAAEKALQTADRIQDSANQALKEIRMLVFETQTFLFDETKTLQQSLIERLDMVERRAGITAELRFPDDFPALTQEENAHLYWMVIEVLNNSLKHSRASRVRVGFDVQPDGRLTFEVDDNGIGFEPSRITSGYGTKTIQERAQIMRGSLAVQSAPGQGTKIQFTKQAIHAKN